MRTTLSLADDVVLIARQRARIDQISLGEAVSRLVREGCRAQRMQPADSQPLKSRFSVLPVRDELITSEHVRKLMDQEGL